MIKLLIILICIFLLIFIFIKTYKPFGSLPSKKDIFNYSKRSNNLKKSKFKNINKFKVMSKGIDTYKDRKTNKGVKPKDELPFKMYEYIKQKNNDILITWFGHSSILIGMNNMNILIDPIFDKRSSPFSFLGPKRYSKIPVQIDKLPNIDILIITHNHYDHLSYKTTKLLDKKVGRYIVPLGVDADLEKFRIDKPKIKNMAWWEETNINGLKIACLPAKHFSGRFIVDSNKTLWASFIIQNNNFTIFDSGDTGYDNHFKKIQKKYGKIDLAILDGAQYNEKWHNAHMFPEETVKAAIDLQANITMLNHFGAFVLSNNSWDEAIDRFVRRAKEEKIEYVTPILGETFYIKDYKQHQKEWWKKIK